MIKKVYQQNLKDCGVASLISIIRYYGGDNTFENVRYLTKCSNNGITALNLIEASKKLGFNSRGLRCEYNDLNNLQIPLLCHIVLPNGYNHYIVLYKFTYEYVIVFDPYYGIKKYDKDSFLKLWDNIVIELIPNRKLDVIREDNYVIIKNILKKHKLSFIFSIIISFILILLTLFSNIYFKLLVDGYNSIYILLIFIFMILIRELIGLLKNKIIINLENDVDKHLVLDTHKRLLSLPNYYFNSRTSGDIITKFNDLEYVKELVVKFPIFIILDIVLMIITSMILVNISFKLSIVFFIVCLIYFIILFIYNKKLSNSIKLNQESNSFKNAILLENINCIDTIKNMDIKEYRYNIFSNVFDLYKKSSVKYLNMYNIINALKNIILYVGLNIILFIGINTIKLSDLILFESLIIYFIEPLNDIFSLVPILKNGKNALKRVSEIYNIEIDNNEKCIDTFDIKFNNLTFSYDGYKNIIENFNYDIMNKDKIMVIGKSGSGKSTLFKLLNKAYKIDNGMIYVSNTDINDLNINDYLTYVSQDEKLFNDSIYNNIVLNNDNNIDEVLKITGINEVLKNKNLNIYSVIEEDGSNLSRGEKQRIIVARALLRNKNIIVLDESLNGLEEYDEYEIMKNILKKFSDKTIIYISHSKVCSNLFNKKLSLS